MRSLTNRILATSVLVCALVVAIPATAFAAQRIGLSSGTFKFEVEDGGSAEGQVVVTNDGDEEVSVLVYSADQSVSDTGDISYEAPTRADITQLDRPSSWISVSMPKDSKSLGNVPYIVLKPGDRVPVDFVIQVPAGSAPGDHNLLVFFEMFDRQSQAEGAQTVVSGRIGTRITMRVEGEVVERLSLRPFEVPIFVIGSEAPFTARINNEGNVDQRVTMNAYLRNRDGNDLNSSRPIDARLVFARESLEATGVLVADRMPVGPMTLAVEIIPVDDAGSPIDSGQNNITDERQVWFIPMWLLLVVAAVLVLLVARIIWMFAVRSAKKSQAASVAGAEDRAEVDTEDVTAED